MKLAIKTPDSEPNARFTLGKGPLTNIENIEKYGKYFVL